MNPNEFFTDKEIKLIQKKPKLRIFVISFFCVFLIVCIILSILYFKVAFIHARHENIENITSVIGSNIDVNKTYSGRVAMIN